MSIKTAVIISIGFGPHVPDFRLWVIQFSSAYLDNFTDIRHWGQCLFRAKSLELTEYISSNYELLHIGLAGQVIVQLASLMVMR